MRFTDSLKFRLALFLSLITLLPTLLVGLIAYAVLRDSLLDTATVNLQNSLTTQMANFDVNIANIEMALDDISTSQSTQAYIQLRTNREDAAYYNSLRVVASKLDSVVNQRGDAVRAAAILWNDGDTPLARGDTGEFGLYGEYTRNFPFLEFLVQDAGVRWLVLADEGGRRHIYVYKPLYAMAEPIGVVALSFYPDYPNSMFNIPAEPGGFGLLLDERQEVLYATEPDGGLQPELAAILSASEGAPAYGTAAVHLDGERFLAAYAVSGVNGWRYVFASPYANVLRSTGAITIVVLAVTLACLAAAILSSMALYRYINSPIQRLVEAMSGFQKGDMEARVSGGHKGELGLLGQGFNRMAEEALDLLAGIRHEQAQKREAEMRFLQAQVGPHFLYNTLNTAKVLARMERTADVQKIITALISLLRLTSNGGEQIPLEQEIAYLQNYVSIMEYRKSQRFLLETRIAPEALACVIPKFSLQPVVENSILHGFPEAETDCQIRITAAVDDHVLTIQIMDNGVGFTSGAKRRAPAEDGRFNKVGIENVDQRIKLYYGSAYGLTTESEPGKGTRTTLTMPAAVGVTHPNDKTGE